MKVLALILMAIVSANGKGSGPYLYQRPEGLSFNLPSEIVKPLPTPELNFQGSEASGSDSLQEYGPPKVQQESSQNLLNQGLPDVTVEQTFGFVAQIGSQGVAEKVVEISEAKPEVISTELPTTASQSSLDNDPPISAELPILDFEAKATTTTPNVEQITEIISQSNQLSQASLQHISEQTNQQNTESQTTEVTSVQSNQLNSQETISVQSNQQNTEAQTTELTNVQTNQQNSQETVNVQSNQQDSTQSLQYQQESSTVTDLEKVTGSLDSIGNTEVLLVNAVPESISEQKVPVLQNIPDIIASLDKEIITQQAEVNQAVSEIGSIQSLGQIPEGSLEYGPPGFIEYGPPKGDQEKSENIQTIESNETRRRRRFSPRLRHGKN